MNGKSTRNNKNEFKGQERKGGKKANGLTIKFGEKKRFGEFKKTPPKKRGRCYDNRNEGSRKASPEIVALISR
jgi:hypothetical protein